MSTARRVVSVPISSDATRLVCSGFNDGRRAARVEVELDDKIRGCE
jgi:hypothetical protein